MIEPARIAASEKIKTNVHAVKQNIVFWNDMYQLGLTKLYENASAATWQLENCVLAIRQLDTNFTEFLLLVARRQNGYRWFYGLRPEALARNSWNRLLQLFPRETWDRQIQMLEYLSTPICSDIAELVDGYRMSVVARLVHISEIAQARYGKGADGRVTPEATRRVEEQIAQAEKFKREQAALADLTPDQLAEKFLLLVPSVESSISPSTTWLADEATSAQMTNEAAESQGTEPLRRGGPMPTPEEHKVKIVMEWLTRQGRETQETFCNRKGVATSTLRTWIRELRAQNKLPPS